MCATMLTATCCNKTQVMLHWPLALKPITRKALLCANTLIVCKADSDLQPFANATHAMHVDVLVFCWLLASERPDNSTADTSQHQSIAGPVLCRFQHSFVALDGVAWLLYCLALTITVLPIVVSL